MRVFREITFTRYASLNENELGEQIRRLRQDANLWIRQSGATPTLCIRADSFAVSGEIERSGKLSWMLLKLTLEYETTPGQAVEGVCFQKFATMDNYRLLKHLVRRELRLEVEAWKNTHLGATAKNPCEIIGEYPSEEVCRQKANLVNCHQHIIFYRELMPLL